MAVRMVETMVDHWVVLTAGYWAEQWGHSLVARRAVLKAGHWAVQMADLTGDQKVAWRVAMLAASSVVLMAAPKAWRSADCWVGPMVANLDAPRVEHWAA